MSAPKAGPGAGDDGDATIEPDHASAFAQISGAQCGQQAPAATAMAARKCARAALSSGIVPVPITLFCSAE